jgi:hypothetical protein
MRKRPVARNVPAADANYGYELGFVIDFAREPRNDNRIAIGTKRRRELAEHHRLRRRLFASFLGVIGIV